MKLIISVYRWCKASIRFHFDLSPAFLQLLHFGLKSALQLYISIDLSIIMQIFQQWWDAGSSVFGKHFCLWQATVLASIMVVLEVVHDESFASRITFSIVGAVISFALSLLLLVNTVYHIYKIYKTPSKRSRGRPAPKPYKAHIMAVIYLVSSFLASVTFAFVQTEMHFDDDTHKYRFTATQCFIGYLCSYTFYYTACGVIYIVFVWRIGESLKGILYGPPVVLLRKFQISNL